MNGLEKPPKYFVDLKNQMGERKRYKGFITNM